MNFSLDNPTRELLAEWMGELENGEVKPYHIKRIREDQWLHIQMGVGSRETRGYDLPISPEQVTDVLKVVARDAPELTFGTLKWFLKRPVYLPALASRRPAGDVDTRVREHCFEPIAEAVKEGAGDREKLVYCIRGLGQYMRGLRYEITGERSLRNWIKRFHNPREPHSEEGTPQERLRSWLAEGLWQHVAPHMEWTGQQCLTLYQRWQGEVGLQVEVCRLVRNEDYDRYFWEEVLSGARVPERVLRCAIEQGALEYFELDKDLKEQLASIGGARLLYRLLDIAQGEEFRTYFRQLSELQPMRARWALNEFREHAQATLQPGDLTALIESPHPACREAAIRFAGSLPSSRDTPEITPHTASR